MLYTLFIGYMNNKKGNYGIIMSQVIEKFSRREKYEEK